MVNTTCTALTRTAVEVDAKIDANNKKIEASNKKNEASNTKIDAYIKELEASNTNVAALEHRLAEIEEMEANEACVSTTIALLGLISTKEGLHNAARYEH